MLIFEKSELGREALGISRVSSTNKSNDINIEKKYLRRDDINLPEVHEMEVVRHFTNLSSKNFAIDKQFYPLGSCTMKYNPRIAHKLALLPEFANLHPLADPSHNQGFLSCIYELQEMLSDITGMQEVSLSPMAGAQGEFAGVAMIKAYHQDRKDFDRVEMLVPDSAHGTNPASAVQCGFTVKEIPTKANGDLDLDQLKKLVGPKTAGIMLTNPSTLGLFERDILEIAKTIHEAGGLLYYDGANLNAILGRVRPGDMGFDVMHMNLHKTFATPHGGGGPGSGPVAANSRLAPYLPTPIVAKIKNDDGSDKFVWHSKAARPKSIGRLSAFMGNAGVLLRAYIYIRALGREGLSTVSDLATLNANYLAKRLYNLELDLAFPDRLATHEFIVTLKKFVKNYNINAMDVAKRLLDKGFHAPTTYFPLLIPECWLIEPTETESKQEIDRFVAAIEEILLEVKEQPDTIRKAPHTMPVTRLDDVRAVRELDIVYADE